MSRYVPLWDSTQLSVIMHQMLLTGECFVPYPEPNYGVPVHA